MKDRAVIVHVLAQLEASGAERLLEMLGPEAEGDVNHHVVSTGEELVGSFAPRLEAAGFTVHHVPFRRHPSFVLAVWREFRSLCPDVVHIHCERASFWLALAAYFSRHPHVVRSIHNVFMFSGNLRIRRYLQRAIMRVILKCRMLAVSPSVAQNEQARFGNTCDVLETWIDHDRFSPATPHQKTLARADLHVADTQIAIAVVGSCSHQKNHSAAIEGLAALCEAGIDGVMLHVGTGQEEDAERQMAKDLGIEDRVRFLGVRPDVEHILSAADVFLMPSRYEGLGVAAVEALSMGLPSVLAHVEGLRDLESYDPRIVWCSPTGGGVHKALTEVIERGVDASPMIAGPLADLTAAAAWKSLKTIYGLNQS